MIVEILCGGYGCPTKTGVHTVSRGERCEVSDAEAARLIGLGVAKFAFSAPTAPETAPAEAPAAAESNDTPAAEASQNGSETAHLDPDQLHDMTVVNLKSWPRIWASTPSSSRPRTHSFRLSAPRTLCPVTSAPMVLNWQLRCPRRECL